MAPTTSSTAGSAPYSRLFELPREIQDMIFTYACQADYGTRVVIRRNWQEDENRCRRLDREVFIPQAFPPLKVNEWLVSRRFFLAAATAYFASLKVDLAQDSPNPHQDDDSNVNGICQNFLFNHQRLYMHFVTRLTLRLCDTNLPPECVVEELGLCPNLRQLVL